MNRELRLYKVQIYGTDFSVAQTQGRRSGAGAGVEGVATSLNFGGG